MNPQTIPSLAPRKRLQEMTTRSIKSGFTPQRVKWGTTVDWMSATLISSRIEA